MRKLYLLIILFFLYGEVHAGIVSKIEFKEEAIFKKECILVKSTDLPPELDGNLNDICWEKADKIRFADTTVYLIHDKKFLYLAFSCLQNNPLIIQKKEHDSKVWEDDCVEIFIDINHDHKTYYQFITNPIGTRYEGFKKHYPGKEGDRYGSSWDSNWQAVALIKKKLWEVEIAIPFSDIGIKKKHMGIPIGFNVCSNHGLITMSNWCKLGDHHTPKEFNHLILVDSPIVLKDTVLGNPSVGRNILFLKIANEKKAARTIKLNVDVEGSLFSKDVNLNQGENIVELSYQIKDIKKTNLTLSGFDKDKKRRLFECEYILSVSPPQSFISCSLPITVYYSSDRKIELGIKINNVLLEEFRKMKLKVELKKRGKLISSEEVKNLSSRKIQLSIDISHLKMGSYSLNIALMDKNGRFIGETEQNFSIMKGVFD